MGVNLLRKMGSQFTTESRGSLRRGNWGSISADSPVKSMHKANEEVERYILKANSFCVPIVQLNKFKKGISFVPAKLELPWYTPNKKLVVYSEHKNYPNGGILAYNIVANPGNKVPQPIFVPTDVLIRLKKLIEEMAKYPELAYELAYNYFENHENEVIFVLSCGVIAIVIEGLVIYGSGGSILTVQAIATPIVGACTILVGAAIASSLN